jgi:hypothetical protein
MAGEHLSDPVSVIWVAESEPGVGESLVEVAVPGSLPKSAFTNSVRRYQLNFSILLSR